MNTSTTANPTNIEPHEPHWVSQAAFPVLTALFAINQIALGCAVYYRNYWLAVPLVLMTSHLMHGMLIGFHEATHGLLRKSRLLNEIDGVIIGTLSLMSFSLYRAAHQLHHAHLATQRDEELWPFIEPTMPRGARVLAARAGFPERPRSDGKPGGDVKQLRGDVDRLLLYAFGQKKISMDDVREVAGPAALQDDWAIANAIEAGQGGEALRQLSLTLDSGAPPEKVLGQLGWLVRSKFPQVAPDELRAAVESVYRTDLDLKRSGGDPRVLLERLVVELSGGKRTRPGYGPRRW